MRPQNRALQAQRGVTILVVIVLLTVMLLGALSLARITEATTLSAGNASYRDASLQASDVGLNAAFNAVVAIPVLSEDQNAGNWYWSRVQPQDAHGMPQVDWSLAPETVVGAYSVRYVVERVCEVAVVSDPLRECLVKSIKVPTSGIDGEEKLDPPNSRQYRATVRVTGPKNTTTFIQSLLTKG